MKGIFDSITIFVEEGVAWHTAKHAIFPSASGCVVVSHVTYCFPSDMEVVRIAARNGEVWALASDGRLATCRDGELTYQEGEFSQLAGGFRSVCAIRKDKTLTCWGLEEDEMPPPSGTFSYVASGGYDHGRGGYGNDTCAIRTDGSIACFGYRKESKYRNPKEGPFIKVAVGDGSICALRPDLTAVCWCECDSVDCCEVEEVAEGPFMQIAAGYDYACGLKTDGRFKCWGKIRR